MKTAVIILAAGEGKRMTKTKQLLPWGNTTVLGKSVECYRNVEVKDLIIVIGYMAETIQSRINDDKIIWVYNDNYKEEMAYSFKKGFEKINDDIDALYLALGDTPAIREETLKLMEKAFVSSKVDIVIPVFDGHRGHPVLFSKDVFKDLAEIGDKFTLKDVVKNNKENILYLDVNDGNIINDIDTLDEYRNLLKMNNLKIENLE